MRLLLCGVSGPAAGIRGSIEDGCTLTVGRGEQNQLCVGQDNALSGSHLVVSQVNGVVHLRDLQSRNGTRVNGVSASECTLRVGDQIQVGKSVFVLLVHAEQLPAQVQILSSQPEKLYAVLDAARDDKILELLEGSEHPFYSLYFGESMVELRTVAPYLVPLAPHSELLTKIITEGWSHSWGIFLTCAEPVDAIWKQLRRSLLVNIQGSPEQVYFRFYDPRVFRTFFPMSTPGQRAEFSTGISRFFAEDENPLTLLQFNATGSGPLTECISIDNREGTMNYSESASLETTSVFSAL